MAKATDTPKPGEYRTDGKSLFYVLHVPEQEGATMSRVEDCGSDNDLMEIDTKTLGKMEVVTHG